MAKYVQNYSNSSVASAKYVRMYVQHSSSSSPVRRRPTTIQSKHMINKYSTKSRVAEINLFEGLDDKK
jgi:hypothetical protein